MAVAPIVSGVGGFADDFLGDEQGVDLTRLGPASETLAARLRDEGHDGDVTAALIATLYWQAFILSPAYPRALQQADVDPADTGRRIDRMIVPHPIAGSLVQPRFDLIVFVEDYDLDPCKLGAELADDELLAGFAQASKDFHEAAAWGLAPSTPAHIAIDSFEAVEEAHRGVSFQLLVARRPSTSLTSVPNPAWDVRQRAGAPDYGSAGVVARNAAGQLGVTLPNHLFWTDEATMTPVGTPVTVHGVAATVASCNLITDSCFATLPVAQPSAGFLHVEDDSVVFQEPVARALGGLRSVASGFAPGHGSQVSFTGALSDATVTVISGYDPFVYVPSKVVARCVYTENTTGPGDSGALLLDAERRAIGFALERSDYDERPEFSSWIWAESVIRAHGLTLLSAPRTGDPPAAYATPV